MGCCIVLNNDRSVIAYELYFLPNRGKKNKASPSSITN